MKYSIVHVGPEKWFNYKADACFGILGSLIELGYDVTKTMTAKDRTNIVIGIDWLVNNKSTNLLKENDIEYIARAKWSIMALSITERILILVFILIT